MNEERVIELTNKIHKAYNEIKALGGSMWTVDREGRYHQLGEMRRGYGEKNAINLNCEGYDFFVVIN